MKKLLIKERGIYFIIIPMISLISICPERYEPFTWPDPQPACGIGTGSFYLTTTTSSDYAFDCNTESEYRVSFSFEIDASYHGSNRIYLTLENTSLFELVQSNYVDVPDGGGDAEVEIGGSLPSGLYNATLWMVNYQFGSTCPENKYRNEHFWLPPVDVTECGPPAKGKLMEYDFQLSDSAGLNSYDVLVGTTSQSIRRAFRAGSREDTIITDDENLPPETMRIIEDNNTCPDCETYVTIHKDDPLKMYLVGIKRFLNSQGDPLTNRLGHTINAGAIPSQDNRTGSFIAVKTIYDWVRPRPDISGYEKVAPGVVVHELGHQRGCESHDDHSSFYCVMLNGLEVQFDFGWVNLWDNPHFCSLHLDTLKMWPF